MRLEQLQLLQTLLTTGSLRAASELMNVSPPALTKSLQQLEQDFGAALVIRSPKGVRLTTAGEVVAARAEIVLREIKRAREEVNWQTQHGFASMTIATSPAAVLHVLPGALARLRSRWPKIRIRVVELVYPRGLTVLRAGEADITVGPLPKEGVGRDLCQKSLFEVQQVIIARAGHPFASAKRLQDIQHEAWINSSPPGGPGDPNHLGFFELGLQPPDVCMNCESFSTLAALLPSLDALALVPESFFLAYAGRKDLVQLPIEDPLPRINVYSVWRADAPLTTQASFLLDALEAEAQGLNK